jgi:hypothetical protein
MEFLVKIVSPNLTPLNSKNVHETLINFIEEDIVKDLNNGLHMICGSGDPNSPWLQKLKQVKVVKVDKEIDKIFKDYTAINRGNSIKEY